MTASRRGDVYQVNLCRLLTVPGLPPDLRSLGAALARGNPAPYAAAVSLPGAGVHVASASPELFLSRDGDRVASGPIKGTGRTVADLGAKDRAENVMIVDLVRNDLARVCEPGSVEVPSLLRVEPHPGLVHLVSTVSGRLRPGCGWPDLLAAAAPPGSVSGAPKSSALRIIARARTRAARRLLRRGRLGGRRPGHGVAGGGHPHVQLGRAGHCSSARARASRGGASRCGSGTRRS